MKRLPIDVDLLRELSKDMSPKEISTYLALDPRVVHRLMRNANLLQTPEPDESIKLRIKDTPTGRKLAAALGLKVGVIYPDAYKRESDKVNDEV